MAGVSVAAALPQTFGDRGSDIMVQCIRLTCFTVLVFAISSAAFSRTWTDRKGRQVDAELLSFEAGNVKLKRNSDGRVFNVPLDGLNDSDQEFVKSHTTGSPKASDPLQDDAIFTDAKAELLAALSELQRNGKANMWLMADTSHQGFMLGGEGAPTDNPAFDIIAFFQRLKTGKLPSCKLKPIPLSNVRSKYGSPRDTKKETLATRDLSSVEVTWYVYGNVWFGVVGSSSDVTWFRLLPGHASK